MFLQPLGAGLVDEADDGDDVTRDATKDRDADEGGNVRWEILPQTLYVLLNISAHTEGAIYLHCFTVHTNAH